MRKIALSLPTAVLSAPYAAQAQVKSSALASPGQLNADRPTGASTPAILMVSELEFGEDGPFRALEQR